MTIAGEKIFYTRHGGGSGERRNLVLVHGAGESHLHWPPGLRRLEGTDVYALDLPGHGRSGGRGRDSIAAYRDLLAAFLDALGLERAVLVGHSMGGAIVLSFALNRPNQLEGMVLVSSGARLKVLPAILDGILSDFDSTVELICSYAYGPEASKELMETRLEWMKKVHPEALHGDFAACDAFDMMGRLGEIQLPTLAICGTEDKLTPPKYSAYLRDHIPGAQLVLVEEGGHMVMLEQPEEVERAVAKFVAPLI